MRNIDKGSEPTSLREHRSTPGADWDGYKGKHEAFRALCREQGFLCAYCMSRIKPDQEPRKIEHWIARNHSADSPHPPAVHEENRLRWANLLGVCPGVCGPKPASREAAVASRWSAAPALTQHCDTYRGNKRLAIHPAAETRPLGTLFQYRKNGEVWSNDAGAARDIETLNLNVWRLVEHRRGVVKRLRKALPTPPRQWTGSVLRKELEKWRERTARVTYQDGESGSQTAIGFREYSQVAISFLERQIRKRGA